MMFDKFMNDESESNKTVLFKRMAKRLVEVSALLQLELVSA